MTQFRVGDHVEWEGQVRGRKTNRVGRVLAVVPKNGDPYAAFHFCFRVFDTKCKALFALGRQPRPEESYLIEVQTAVATKAVYWPRVSTLKKVEPTP